MPTVTFSEQDLLERNQLPAGWYKMKVESVDEGLGKKDPTSIVWEIKFIITDEKQTNTPIRHWLSEKARGRVVDFVRCFTGGEVEKEKKYELSETIGREILGYTLYDPNQGFNVIKDFKPIGR